MSSPNYPPPKLIDVSLILPSPFQPRTTMDEGKLRDLADSIAKDGILQPPHVRPARGKAPYEYHLVFGHRRLEAAKLAGFAQIPAVVRADLENDDFTTSRLAIAENSDTEPIADYDDARALFALWEAYNREAGHEISQNQFCRRIGRAPQYVINRRDTLCLGDDLKPIAQAHSGVMTQLILIDKTRGELREKLKSRFDTEGKKRLSVIDVRQIIADDDAARRAERETYTPPDAHTRHRVHVAAEQGSAAKSHRPA